MQFTKQDLENKISEFIFVPTAEYKAAAWDETMGQEYDHMLAANTEIYKAMLNRDRALYIAVRDIVYKYCARHRNVMILDREPNMMIPEMADNLALYGYNAYKIANDITALIYAATNHPFILCKTVIEHGEFTIEINARTMVYIFSLAPGSNRNANVCQIVDNKTTGASEAALLMPPEFELVQLYDGEIYGGDALKLLKNPNEYIDGRLADARIRYRAHIEKLRKSGGGEPENITGGAKRRRDRKYGRDRNRDDRGNGYNSGHKHTPGSICERKVCRDRLIDQIKLSIVQNWVRNQNDTVLIGSWAHSVWKHGDTRGSKDRIQLFCHRGASRMFADLKHFVQKNIGDYSMTLSKVYPVELPDEYRLTRNSIKIVAPGSAGMKEYLLMEYFSALEYSAVPACIISGYRVACKEIMLKYIFINLWITLNVYLSNAVSVRRYITFVEGNWGMIDDIIEGFPGAKVMVGYHTPYIEYRKYSMLEGKRFTPVNPAMVQSKKR